MNLLLNDIILVLRGRVVTILRLALLVREHIDLLNLWDSCARRFCVKVVCCLLLRVVQRSHLLTV